MIRWFINGFLHFSFYLLSHIFIFAFIPLFYFDIKLLPGFFNGIVIIIIWLISGPFIFGFFIKLKYQYELKPNILKKWLFGIKHFFYTVLIIFVSGLLLQIPFMLITIILHFIFKIGFNNTFVYIIFVILYFPVLFIIIGYFLEKSFYKNKIENRT